MIELNTAIDNVLNGKTAFGEPREGRVECHSKLKPKLKTLTASFLTDQRGSVKDNDSRLTGLIEKTTKFIGGEGLTMMPTQMQNVIISVRDEITSNPAILETGLSLMQIMEEHKRVNATMAEKLQNLRETPPPAPEAILSVPPYMLVELKTPEDLKFESAVLGHCIGTNYSAERLAEAGITRDNPASDRHLTYGIKIRSKEARIFSLRGPDGEPVATINYSPKQKRIVEIESSKETNEDIENQDFFPAICQAMHALKQKIDISRGFSTFEEIVCTPDSILTKDGEIRAYSDEIDQDSILWGTATMKSNNAEALLNQSTMVVEVHMSNKDFNALSPQNILATLSFNSSQNELSIDTAHTQNLHFFHSKCATAKNLKTARNIDAFSPRELYLPALEKAEDIEAPFAEIVEIPLLRRAKSIKTKAVLEFELPELEQAADIYAPNAKIFDTPRLRKASDLHFSEATHIDIRSLTEFKSVNGLNKMMLERITVHKDADLTKMVTANGGLEDLGVIIEAEGMLKQENEDGSITYIHPDALSYQNNMDNNPNESDGLSL